MYAMLSWFFPFDVHESLTVSGHLWRFDLIFGQNISLSCLHGCGFDGILPHASDIKAWAMGMVNSLSLNHE